jgi:beta-lactamase class A
MTGMFAVNKALAAPGSFARAVLSAIIAAALLLAGPSATLAQPIATNDAVARIFQQEIDPDWFAPAFLAQVPFDQIDAIVVSFTGQFGPLVEVTGSGGTLTTRFERAEMQTQITLDGDGRIIGLLFGPAIPLGVDLNDMVNQIAALPGEVSVLVLTDGEVAAGYQPELALGVGSAFKLAVLAALTDEIAAGPMAWDDVVALDPARRSHPSGILQGWPEGTPLTLATLANLMISISDNTAADMLLDVVGRERVEAEGPRNAPFLATGEMFRLKSQGNEGLAAAWIDGNEDARRAILAEIDAMPLPPVGQFSPQPILGIEWFFNAFELCALLDRVADSPVFTINPGIASAGDWSQIAFKGGSEPGVLNLSTRVVAADGTTHCVVASWNNDAALNEQALFSLYGGLLGVLAAGG